MKNLLNKPAIAAIVLTIITPSANAVMCNGVLTDAEARIAAISGNIESVHAATVSAVNSPIDRAISAIKEKQCKDIKTPSFDLLNNPFVYVDPNASAANCGLGFSLPGLPSFGGLGSLPSLDLCKAVKAVTGDTMDKINQSMEDWRDKAVDSATSAVDGVLDKATGGVLGGDGNISDKLNSKLGIDAFGDKSNAAETEKLFN